ncbi:glucoamylase [Candida albicans L26]|uniref:glucan 1,4-alpha-glucosidase n=2 Tax=Candida albicans TaxID=5476 RepID=Q5AJ73_CANAL|nr:glucan 1,4-alpha-glucosidase [Candida albicans SC5314]KGQ92068.1 glucoamylase [Candida albicans P37005]KGR12527.1 glucoamylase [Candida albicans P78048]KGR17256.1 glucoamylase [Candida albicans P37037]KGT70153.1 glucoamylase [Candida albicans 12C]KGU11787.1 glucoamylase [Candida albicans 19F]KGU12617.1 glucoamylase [Candida albicans L26]KGU30970.1 glucoamylase [Candida albicans P75063]KHC56526.1 glucoamylase [Candida albicans P37039]|eukprot:XP_721790.1 glucan 1,4-alpha-glucosidase [Candida albicans SC5314]
MRLLSFNLFIIFIINLGYVNSFLIPTKGLNLFHLQQQQQQSIFSTNLKQALTTPPPNSFYDWLVFQKQVCLKSILNNIGGDFTIDNKDLLPGVVIASPSTSNPDYYYQWTRDSAIIINILIDHLSQTPLHLINKNSTSSLVHIIESYIFNTQILQQLPNLSGNVDNLENLGEPKFHVNLTAFNESWGRPQRDGPGLRSIAIMNYLSLLNNTQHQPSFSNLTMNNTSKIYHDIIKPDLKYSIEFWQFEGFDLWEEIKGIHFFTSLVQLKSLTMGLKFAQFYNDSFEFRLDIMNSIELLTKYIELESGFINNEDSDGDEDNEQQLLSKSYIISSPKLFYTKSRSGLDIASILAVLYTHNNNNANDDDDNDFPFDVDNGLVLTTLRYLIQDMTLRYPINFQDNFQGVALGRYPEDIYDGYGKSEGNPWFISTATASELIYRLIYKLKSNNQAIIIDQKNIEFYKEFIHSVSATEISNNELKFEAHINGHPMMIINKDDKLYDELINKLFHYADGFLKVVQKHVDNNGDMNEQFNKYIGFMQGAEKLTWSYGAVFTAINWRNKTLSIL